MYPSLAVAVAAGAKGTREATLRVLTVNASSLKFEDLASPEIPLDGKGNLLLRYRGPKRTFAYVSAADVLSGAVDASAFRDKLVFVGTTALGTREVVGADCRIVSSIYTTEVVTPSRLVVPNFGPQSPELVATCRAGDLTGTGRTRIITRWQPSPWGWGYPGPGPWGFGYPGPGPWGWGSPVGWGWYEPSYPVSDYPDLIVTMR